MKRNACRLDSVISFDFIDFHKVYDLFMPEV